MALKLVIVPLIFVFVVASIMSEPRLYRHRSCRPRPRLRHEIMAIGLAAVIFSLYTPTHVMPGRTKAVLAGIDTVYMLIVYAVGMFTKLSYYQWLTTALILGLALLLPVVFLLA